MEILFYFMVVFYCFLFTVAVGLWLYICLLLKQSNEATTRKLIEFETGSLKEGKA